MTWCWPLAGVLNFSPGLFVLCSSWLLQQQQLERSRQEPQYLHDLISEVKYHHLCHNFFFTQISPCMREITQRYEYQEVRIICDSAGGCLSHHLFKRFSRFLSSILPTLPYSHSSNSLKIRAPGDCPIKSH